ncbi:hypothetical protein NLX67_02195 [Domibacillus sp. A3M-37]|uniref:hypothetical protein n=1 Tax=Domibacillus sp. A3M-37 TaxID=2962037 RepID=UPI0020B7C264|nr:hypothetical protein [Domibacillus sp. A3M-37]MCP3761204.1 hypothetical protein [Domibacillus sp. A3M-37]
MREVTDKIAGSTDKAMDLTGKLILSVRSSGLLVIPKDLSLRSTSPGLKKSELFCCAVISLVLN